MKQFFLYVQALLYVAAGVNHFWHVQLYTGIMPFWLPWHTALVYVSGVLEVVFGLLLLTRFTRRLGAVCIIMLLIAVFPANVQMAINYADTRNPNLWVAIVRLPLQALLIWWAWWYYKYPALKQKPAL